MPLVSKFLFGMKDAADCLSAVHMYASEADLKAVKKMFAPDSEFGKMLAENPVIKGETFQGSTFEVRVVVGKEVEEDETMVAGVYAHGVPDFEEWLKLFSGSFGDDGPSIPGLLKSYGGKMLDGSAWDNADAPGGSAMVLHIFKDLNSKAVFDMMFDPTTGMFKDIKEAGGVIAPFYNQSIGPFVLPPFSPPRPPPERGGSLFETRVSLVEVTVPRTSSLLDYSLRFSSIYGYLSIVRRFVRSAEHACQLASGIIAAARRPVLPLPSLRPNPAIGFPAIPPPPKTWMKGRFTSVVALSEAERKRWRSRTPTPLSSTGPSTRKDPTRQSSPSRCAAGARQSSPWGRRRR